MPRHSWQETHRSQFKTERNCRRDCGWIKVTRHDAGPGGVPWTEWWRGGERLQVGGHTPACEAVAAVAA